MASSMNHATLARVIGHSFSRSCALRRTDRFAKLPPLHIWGASGIGKSQVTREQAKAIAGYSGRRFLDWNSCPNKSDYLSNEALKGVFIFADVRLSQLDPTDLRGLPDLFSGKGRNEYVAWKPALLFKVLSLPDAAGVLFFDEMNLASPSVQAACYQIILDNGIGEITLAPDVYVTAAGNRMEDRANVFEMAGPLKNRFRHVILEPPSEKAWMDYAMDREVDGRIIGFIHQNPALLNGAPPGVDHKSSEDYATASPRGWEFLSNDIVGVTDMEFVKTLARMPVGVAAAAQFGMFLDLGDSEIKVDDVLEDPKQIKLVTRSDIQWYIMSGISERCRSDDTLYPKALAVVPEMNPDFSVFLLRLLKGVNSKKFLEVVLSKKSYKELVRKYTKFLMDTLV